MRGPICLLVALMPVGLLFLMLGVIRVGDRVAEAMVGRKHRALEEVLRTGQAPAAWRRHHDAHIARERKAGGPGDAQRRAQADYLHRLDGLIRYVQGTALVEDEETRGYLLEKLTAIRAQWEGQDAIEL